MVRRWIAVDAEPHRLAVVATVALLGMGVGAVNEVVEFALTHLLEETEVGGFQNTGRDLVANMLGGVTAGGIVSRRPGG